MPKTDNEDFKTTYRPPYPVDASACAKILKISTMMSKRMTKS